MSLMDFRLDGRSSIPVRVKGFAFGITVLLKSLRQIPLETKKRPLTSSGAGVKNEYVYGRPHTGMRQDM
jgi:hypothetical protein